MPILDPSTFTYPVALEQELKVGSGSASGIWLRTDSCLERVRSSSASPLDMRGHSANVPYFPRHSPFTPCLTPSSSTTPSSPRSHYELEGYFREESYASRRASIDSSTSRASSYGMSPEQPARSLASPYMAPIIAASGCSSPQPRYSTHTLTSSTPKIQSCANTCDVPPKKKARHVVKAASEMPQGSSETPSLSIVAIPPAQASDLPFNSSRKSPVKRGQPATGKPSRPPRRIKAEEHPPSSQSVKFRFVSVQHASQTNGTSSTPIRDDEEGRVHFEEHMEEEADDGPFEHGPTEFPPRPYPGGVYATSPLEPKKAVGKIPASNLDFLPVLEARFSRLETAIDRYLEHRAEQALRNSILPSPNIHSTILPHSRDRRAPYLVPQSESTSDQSG
ncbi:hypothetical protein K439DRAFT_1639390 [Ramaria rubella]|nr:hypothetical protein K439DRAFT_1639390 [Ramaria rubella]